LRGHHERSGASATWIDSSSHLCDHSRHGTKGETADRSTPEQADYRTWKARAAALLERQGLPPGVMRERDWRQLYIGGKAPEDAVRQAETMYYNTRPAFERIRGKKR
jgi:hypothetical protein